MYRTRQDGWGCPFVCRLPSHSGMPCRLPPVNRAEGESGTLVCPVMDLYRHRSLDRHIALTIHPKADEYIFWAAGRVNSGLMYTLWATDAPNLASWDSISMQQRQTGRRWCKRSVIIQQHGQTLLLSLVP
jgi:hypothetical protein